MIKKFGKLTLATILAAVVLGEPISSLAQTTNTPPAAGAAETPAPKKAKKPKAAPFNGKLLKVDEINKTITLEGKKSQRVFQITSDTTLMKDGKPALLEDAVVGDDVGGRFTKDADGKMTATSVRFGPKPKAESAEPAKPAETNSVSATSAK